jgi:hypothetical protein
MRTKRQPNNNRSRVHDSVNHPRLRSLFPARYYRVRLVP